MTSKPAYFDGVREEAARRWDQLEADPVLAGPWHQLFRQVQSPRHVLSELLQNADDAGASQAFVRVEDGFFVFGHNGRDFTEDEFRSLCRFGYSNKRVLRTIGFRGVGFKSTFSLGDTVELHTPTLAAAFGRSRFTEPRWLDHGLSENGRTVIRIPIADSRREEEVLRNLDDWWTSPLSLLFFRSLVRLRIGDSEISTRGGGPGPADGCEWIELAGRETSRLLLIRSHAEPLPPEAIEEIRQERMLLGEEELEFAPATVELVLGAAGRLFVVLPTDVGLDIPFACNAPFVQDPARDRIKDPEISPTNQWLLERAGALAGSVMVNWLANTGLGLSERASAYELFPTSQASGDSLGSSCARVVRDALMRVIEEAPCLLTEQGDVVARDQSVILSRPLLDVWAPNEASALFDPRNRPPLARDVPGAARSALAGAGLIERVELNAVFHALMHRQVRKPDSWSQLQRLWAYSEEHGPRSFSWSIQKPGALKIVPVAGDEWLHPATHVIRLPERVGGLGGDDARLLRDSLPIVDGGWLRHLKKQERAAEERDDQVERDDDLRRALGLLETLHLDRASNLSNALERLASRLFTEASVSIAECVRLARIAAKLNATLSPDSPYRFVTRDKERRSARKGLLFDADGSLEELLPAEWAEEHLLHPAYGRSFSTCSRDEWNEWLASGRAPLHTSPPLRRTEQQLWERADIAAEIERRGGHSDVGFPYVGDHFVTEDWDFPPQLWDYWRSQAEADEEMWARIMERVILSGERQFAHSWAATQIARNGNERTITAGIKLAPSWILSLGGLPCLFDIDGHARHPYDLLLRTAETEPVIGIDPFIRHDLDTPETRSLLLLLGVGDRPTGPGRLLERIRALAGVANPPVAEVEGLYRRLDQLAAKSSTDELAEIRAAFADEPLVLSEEGDWRNTSFVFVSADEDDVPGAPVVRSAVRNLTVWRRIGVLDRPTADHAIRWLMTLPGEEEVDARDLKRVRALLKRHPDRIWDECGHWLNLSARWTPVASLEYALTQDRSVNPQGLHDWIKQITADFRMVPRDALGSLSSDLSSLARSLDRTLESEPNVSQIRRKDWLEGLGSQLRWVVLETEEETHRIQSLAARLAQTNWVEADQIRVLPLVDGKPAGTPDDVEAAWIGTNLYVAARPVATVAPAVSEELSSVFGRLEIADAIKLCFERDAQFVREYVEATFTLDAPTSTEPDDAGSELDSTDESGGLSLTDFGRDADWPDADGEVAGATDEDTDSSTDEAVRRRRHKRPSIIERLALSQGFQAEGDGVFVHPDGSRIVKQTDGLFPWEKYGPAGNLLVRYWGKDHILERRPLEIESDVWNGLEADPERSALVLASPSGEPRALSGNEILELKARGELRLFPATYRVRLDRSGSRQEG